MRSEWIDARGQEKELLLNGMDDPSKAPWDPAKRMVRPAITNGPPDERILLLDGIHEDMLSDHGDPERALVRSAGELQERDALRYLDDGMV